MKKAVILTEGGKKNGFGHISRCLALRDAFIAKRISTVTVVDADASAKIQFRGQLDKVFNWRKEKNKLFKILNHSDIVVIDSYLAPLNLYQQIANRVKLPIYLDDFVRLDYPRGAIHNGALGTKRSDYSASSQTDYLLGGQYALLRKDFWKVRPKKVRPQINNIFVTFGGISHASFIQQLLTFLAPQFPNYRFHVVLAQTTQQPRLKLKQIRFYCSLSAKKMRSLMQRCDLAITAGGQTTHELAICGIPMIGICFAENQCMNIRGWQKAGCLDYVGHFEEPSLFKKISQLLKSYSYKKQLKVNKLSQRSIDGKGALRVARYAEIFCEN